MFDVLICGGGVSGISLSVILGSAKNKSFVSGKKIGIFTHQKTSSLQEAIFNNAYGIAAGTLGSDLLKKSTQHLSAIYPHVTQIPDEKVLKIAGKFPEFTITTNKNSYRSKMIVIAVGAANTFSIEGLMQYIEPHQKSIPEKQRIQLRNIDHKVAEGIYVGGTLAGWGSQPPIASRRGAAVGAGMLSF